MAVGRDKAFEIFVKRAITSIHKEAWGRTKESKDIKDACQNFLTLLEQHEAGQAVYEGSLAVAVLHPLTMACASSNVKIVELALGALHKLVAHAWLQGESSTSEDLMPDETDIVTRVIKTVIKCGEISNPSLQLSVIRALLTFTTAEHFVAHGDSLMTAVRAVFNLALGSDSEDIKRTACNALLQILNTVSKRVTAFHFSACPTPVRRDSDHDNASMSLTSATGDHIHTLASLPRSQSSLSSARLPPVATPSSHRPTNSSGGPAGNTSNGGLPITIPEGSSGSGSNEANSSGTPDARTAQLAQLAEQQDIRGLEAAIGVGSLEDAAKALATGRPMPDPSPPSISSQSLEAARPSSLVIPEGSVSVAAAPTKSEPGVQLTVLERDVLLVLTAFCKLASREAGLTEVESYLHQGKLLALELLVKVLQNPQHRWENVRDVFTKHLRQPLCITLLRNWAATDPAAFQLAIKLLMAIMLQPKLRGGLKAEFGAFYPLFVLVPLEQGVVKAGSTPSGPDGRSPEPTDLHTLYIVLTTLKQLCSDVQLVVDMFVNYDCDPQAPPLFERTMQVLGLIAQRTELTDKDRTSSSGGQPSAKQQAEASARLAAVRDAALKCIIALLNSIHAWAGPLREQHQADSNGHSVSEAGSSVADSHSDAGGSREAERLEAVWAHKSSLAKGISMFNSKPVKGMQYLIQHGLVDKNAQAVAAFLREHAKEIDKTALGEYMGHHEDFEVAVMHAFIDQERYGDSYIDAALRRLLNLFRLPGEAQKIDRIMEKFAERYYLDNPGVFINADGAYLLSFAIIMLNTDAHNPLAERRLAKPDFVNMCHQTLSAEEGGGMVPVLEPAELEKIFDRIVANEIQILPDNETSTRSTPSNSKQQNGNLTMRNRLAAAMGLHALAAPFKPLTRAWGKSQQGLPEAERKGSLISLAERAIVRGSGSHWVVAVHAELCRPMLTLASGAMLHAFAAGVVQAANVAAADPLLTALLMLAQLAAMLRLDDVCERTVKVLANAAGVSNPAQHGSIHEMKQLAALKALMSLASSPISNSLGSSWAVILRTASLLNALIEDLLQQDHAAAPAAAPTAVNSQTPNSSAAASPFNKMFQSLGISLGGVVTPTKGAGNAAGQDAGGHTNNPAVKAAPGAALVSWAITEGKASLEQLFTLSTSLDGEAVVVYFRALCAVSLEELDQTRPRVTFLQRLVQCAHANTGRIRLIWGKLWTIISSHLVAAACHPAQHVALLAVDALTSLATRLISKTELSHYRAQEEALRPFVSAMRQSDDATVREALVARLSEIVASQPNGLGSGWRTLLDALGRAAQDRSAAVVSSTTHALKAPVRALFASSTPAGHGYFTETVAASAAAAGSQYATAQCNMAALVLLEACAAQLSTLGEVGVPAYAGVGSTSIGHHSGQLASYDSESISKAVDGWWLLLNCLADVVRRQEDRSSVASAACQTVFNLLQDHSDFWSEAAWQVFLGPTLSNIFHFSSAISSAPLSVHVDQQQQAELVSVSSLPPSPEFVARATHFFPLFAGQVGRVSPGPSQQLLEQLATAALQWLIQVHEALMKCGLAGYEVLLSHIIAHKDAPNLKLLMSRLQPALLAQLHTTMQATHDVQTKHLASRQNGVTLKQWPPVLASSSHMLLLAYRMLSRVHKQHCDELQWTEQVVLLSPLIETARQCTLFNQQLETQVLQAAVKNGYQNHSQNTHSHKAVPVKQLPRPLQPSESQTGSPADGIAALPTDSQQETGSLGRPQLSNEAQPQPASQGNSNGGAGATKAHRASDRSSGTGMTDNGDEDMADSILETGTGPTSSATTQPVAPATGNSSIQGISPGSGLAGGRVAQPPIPAVHAHDHSQRNLAAAVHHGAAVDTDHRSAASNPDVLLALVRLELETASAGLDALEIALESSNRNDGSLAQPQKSQQGDNTPAKLLWDLCTEIVTSGAALMTQSLQTRLGSKDATVLNESQNGDVAQSHMHSTWLDGVRAPVLARAVLLASQIPEAGSKQHVRTLFPHLLVIMCSYQPTLREAVSQYFSQTIAPFIMSTEADE